MLRRITLLWIFGLLTIVPLAVYRLLFQAPRDEYAFLIALALFWVFGFWALVGPLVTAYKFHGMVKALQAARSTEDFKRILADPATLELALERIAGENKMPMFLVRLAYRRFAAAVPAKAEEPRHSASS